MNDKYVLTEYALPAGLSQNLKIGLVSDIHELLALGSDPGNRK